MRTVRYDKRSLRTLIAAVVSITLLATGVSGCTFPGRVSGVVEPNIVPSATEDGTQVVQRNFVFEDSRVNVTVPVDKAVYAGSASSQKSIVFIGGVDPGNWVPDYYRAFIAEKHQTAFYESMASALDDVRRKENLDSARYVELVTSMVQQLEYRVDPDNLAPKFPIETFADGYGDCDDKTLLAAALLSRDGYDVAVLLFTPEKHVALGVRAPGLDYKNTGYAYVEMTTPSLVGMPATQLEGGISLTSQPIVVRIGEASGTYTAGAQINDIRERLHRVDADVTAYAKQIDRYKKDLAARQAAIGTAQEAAQAAQDRSTQEAAVRQYNQLVADYNAAVEDYNALLRKYNALVEIESYVAKHQNARPQIHARLSEAGL